METLKPVEINEYYLRRITTGLKRYFWANIFSKIFEVLDSKIIVFNDKSALETAIMSGRVYYENGAFRTTTTFSNAVAQELERINARYKYSAYYIERSALPVQIENAVALKAAQDSAKLVAIGKVLTDLVSQVAVDKYIEKAVELTFKKLETDIVKSAEEKKIPVIEFLPTDKQTQKIAQDYTHNMQYWIKKWEAKEITKMRQDVLKMVSEGKRVPTIRKYFMDRWKIAENKAEFLAINESHLAASVIKATRYQSMGFTHFKWGRSASKEKRVLHEHYYGKIFPYNNPPIIEELPTKDGRKLGLPKPDGQTGLPRQIYNCKCTAEPVINSSFFENRRRIQNAKRNIFTKIKYSIENRSQRHNNPWRYRQFGEGQEV